MELLIEHTWMEKMDAGNEGIGQQIKTKYHSLKVLLLNSISQNAYLQSLTEVSRRVK